MALDNTYDRHCLPFDGGTAVLDPPTFQDPFALDDPKFAVKFDEQTQVKCYTCDAPLPPYVCASHHVLTGDSPTDLTELVEKARSVETSAHITALPSGFEHPTMPVAEFRKGNVKRCSGGKT